MKCQDPDKIRAKSIYKAINKTIKHIVPDASFDKFEKRINGYPDDDTDDDGSSSMLEPHGRLRERSKQRALPVASLTASVNKTWYSVNVTFIMQAELTSTDYATADALMTAIDTSVEEAYGYGTLSAYLEDYCS